MERSDYIPRRDDLFDPWFRALRDYVIGKTSGANPEWAHIPPAAGHLSPAPFPRTAFLHPYAEPLCAQALAVFPHFPHSPRPAGSPERGSISPEPAPGAEPRLACSLGRGSGYLPPAAQA
ncbi:MAG: hypothetical protein MdMp014T_0936 [Treponematales bacterium]